MFTSRSHCLLLIPVFFVGFVNARMTRGETADEYATRAAEAAAHGDHARSIELATQAIQLDSKHASAYKIRARESFCLAKINESIADFERYVSLQPETDPQQWERGIAYFYAGKHREGAAQFERYQTFDGHDVENSVWRFLCMAPVSGVEQAQRVMLPIEKDRRVPMMQVYDLFRGRCQVSDVLTASKEGDPEARALAGRLFYAHLYIGLWSDANGKREEAKRYIDLAADDSLKTNPHINRYMWEVARIHQKLLRGELKVEANQSTSATTGKKAASK